MQSDLTSVAWTFTSTQASFRLRRSCRFGTGGLLALAGVVIASIGCVTSHERARECAKLRTSYGPRRPNSAHLDGQPWTQAIKGSRSTTVEARSGVKGSRVQISPARPARWRILTPDQAMPSRTECIARMPGCRGISATRPSTRSSASVSAFDLIFFCHTRAGARRGAFTHAQAGASICADAAAASSPIPARRPAKTAGAPFHVGRA
jgi:hypothetical protein